MESLSKLPKVTETMYDSNLNNLPPGRMVLKSSWSQPHGKGDKIVALPLQEAEAQKADKTCPKS